MVRVPKEEEAVLWRRIPEPDSEVMAVSADGVMVHLREEGWARGQNRECVSSAAKSRADRRGGKDPVWCSIPTGWSVGGQDLYQPRIGPKSCRRGLEKAKQIVCISDGAAWIWAIVFICFARRTEILDWWHVVQYLWQSWAKPTTALRGSWGPDASPEREPCAKSTSAPLPPDSPALSARALRCLKWSSRPSLTSGTIADAWTMPPIAKPVFLSAVAPSNRRPKRLSSNA